MGVLRTALYCRLSKDDMAQGDSESIRTQELLLLRANVGKRRMEEETGNSRGMML